jgi:hypothetical protein
MRTEIPVARMPIIYITQSPDPERLPIARLHNVPYQTLSSISSCSAAR